MVGQKKLRDQRGRASKVRKPTAWDEIYPFADQKALDAARRLGLGAEVGSLWCLAGTSPSWSPRWSALTSTMHIRTSKEKPLKEVSVIQ